MIFTIISREDYDQFKLFFRLVLTVDLFIYVSFVSCYQFQSFNNHHQLREKRFLRKLIEAVEDNFCKTQLICENLQENSIKSTVSSRYSHKC